MDVILSFRHVAMIRHAISPLFAIKTLCILGLPLSSSMDWAVNNGPRSGQAVPVLAAGDLITGILLVQN